MEKWEGKVALVTGASSGIGMAVAKRLVHHGLKVVGCARNIRAIQLEAKACKGSKGSLFAIQCDVGREDDILAMFDTIRDIYGGVDLLVNNAGLGHNAPLLTGSTDQWKHMFDVNVIGLMMCCREAVRSMTQRRSHHGHVVLLGSMSGHRVLNRPSTHVYSATKFAVRAIAHGLRHELREKKSAIRVSDKIDRYFPKRTSNVVLSRVPQPRGKYNTISPGMVETEFYYRLHEDSPGKGREIYSEYTPIQSEDIVDAVIFALTTPVWTQIHDVLINPTYSKL